MSVTVRFLPDPADGHHRPARGYDVLVSVTGNVIGNTCIVSEDSKGAKRAAGHPRREAI